MKSRYSTRALVFVMAAFALVAAGCGDTSSAPAEIEASDASSSAESTEEAVADTADETEDDTEMSEGDAPGRIVSLSATATEMLFAIGAGEQVVAADSYSNYPEAAPTTELSAFEPNLEAIAAEEPDLVVMAWDPAELVPALEQLGVKTMVLPAAATLDDTYAQLADLGIATGRVDEAATVVSEIRAGIDEIVATAPSVDAPIRVYHELDDTFFSATSSSFIGQLYGLLGLENVADAADPNNETFGFPQLSAEYLIDADPQMIVVTDAIGYSVDDVATRPGWEIISAVRNDAIVQVDDDIASRWGPRVVDFLQLISDALADQLANA